MEDAVVEPEQMSVDEPQLLASLCASRVVESK